MLLFNGRGRSVYGALLFLAGLVGDCLLGVLLLVRGEWRFCGWHFLFVLLWASGVNLLTRRDECLVWQGFVSLNKWGTTALLLGTGTFPGFGVGAYSVACLIVKYGFAPLARQDNVLTELQVTAHGSSLTEPLTLGQRVQPLADDLWKGDTGARRAVIAGISRAATPATTQLLRQLLSDTRAEIRSDASIALSRLDDEMSRVLNAAYVAWQAHPADTDLILALVEQYYKYASSNVLDEGCRGTYLVLARDLLLQMVAQERQQTAQRWLLLARIRQQLGELPEALQDACRALQFQPDCAGASALALELAFHTHAWDILVALASHGANTQHLQKDEPAAFASAQWWVMPDLACSGDVYHG
jgi:hypothetical protein